MARTYWFRKISDGEKVLASTLQEITRLARREATRFAQAVQVHSQEGRKSHRVESMARNPARKVALKRNPTFTGEEWKVSYRTRTGALGSIYARNEREAKDEARLVRAAGGRVSAIVMVKGKIPGARERVAVTKFATNPRRRKGSGQLAVYVVWKNGGQTYRVKCANRGMATIKANALKRDGMAGVKVTSAP